MFTENIVATEDLKLFVSSPSNSEVIVTIETPAYGTYVTRTIVLRPRQTEVVTLPGELQASGTGMENKGIYVRSSDDIVMYGVNAQQGSCGTFAVIPVAALGNNYLAMSWWPNSGDKAYGQIGIVAAEDNVQIQVTIPRSKGVVLTYNGVDYDENKPLELTLNKHQTIQLQNRLFADISGMKVEADHKVAVFSGVVSTNVGSGNRDHIVEQMTPLHAAGITFGVVPFPGESNGYRIRVMSVQDDTTVIIDGSMRTLGTAGQYTDLQSDQSVAITADKPVVVAQFSESQAAGKVGAPSMTLVPPMEQYMNSYTFSLPTPNNIYNSSYILLVIAADEQNQLIMDGDYVGGQRLTIAGSTPSLVGITAGVSGGHHQIYHQNSEVKFGLFLHGTARGTCAFSLVAGMCLKDLTQVRMTSCDLIRTISIVEILPSPGFSTKKTYTFSLAFPSCTIDVMTNHLTSPHHPVSQSNTFHFSLGVIQVLRNAGGGGGCLIFWKKALRRCNIQCY